MDPLSSVMHQGSQKTKLNNVKINQKFLHQFDTLTLDDFPISRQIGRNHIQSKTLGNRDLLEDLSSFGRSP